VETISAISNVVMAAVWVVYFQFFYYQFRRSNRPYLVIHHAQSADPGSVCLLVNMSAEPVHIQAVQVVVVNQAGCQRTLTVTDYERVEEETGSLQRSLRQGPLSPGGFLLLGSFREIVLGRHRSDDDERSERLLREARSIEIRAVVIHGASDFPVAARRVFCVQQNNGARIRPYNVYTEQLTRRKHRSTVKKWLEEELKPENSGATESDRSEQSATSL